MIHLHHRLRTISKLSRLEIREVKIDSSDGTKTFVFDNLPTINEGDPFTSFVRILQVTGLWSQNEGMTELADVSGAGAVYKKIAGSNEPSSYTFTNSTTTDAQYVDPRGFIAVLNQNFDCDVDPVKVYGSGKNSDFSVIMPSFTVTTNGSRAFLWVELSGTEIELGHVGIPSGWELEASDTTNKFYLYTKPVDAGLYSAETIAVDVGGGYESTNYIYIVSFVLSPA